MLALRPIQYDGHLRRMLTLQAPILTSIFSSPFPLHFLCYWLGELDYKSRHLIIGDHFLCSHNLYV